MGELSISLFTTKARSTLVLDDDILREDYEAFCNHFLGSSQLDVSVVAFLKQIEMCVQDEEACHAGQ